MLPVHYAPRNGLYGSVCLNSGGPNWKLPIPYTPRSRGRPSVWLAFYHTKPFPYCDDTPFWITQHRTFAQAEACVLRWLHTGKRTRKARTAVMHPVYKYTAVWAGVLGLPLSLSPEVRTNTPTCWNTCWALFDEISRVTPRLVKLLGLYHPLLPNSPSGLAFHQRWHSNNYETWAAEGKGFTAPALREFYNEADGLRCNIITFFKNYSAYDFERIVLRDGGGYTSFYALEGRLARGMEIVAYLLITQHGMAVEDPLFLHIHNTTALRTLRRLSG